MSDDLTGRLEALVQHLNNIREKLGEEAWKAEIRRNARQGIQAGGKSEIFWRAFIKDFDWLNADELKVEAPPAFQATPQTDMMQMMIEAMRQQIPGLKTQAQFGAAMESFKALTEMLGSIFDRDPLRVEAAMKALMLSLEVAGKVTDLGEMLKDVPEAATSSAADAFKNAPAEFSERDTQEKLLKELALLKNGADLNTWYDMTKRDRDSVKSQDLRNVLLDAIRARKREMTS
jgi:hypothetical protein